jgi:hypothetical protein
MTTRAAKRTNRQSVGIECNGYQKMFASSFSYDQHRRSGYLRRTVCYAFSDEDKTTVTAAQRPNMSTASLECTNGQRKRGSLLHILQHDAYYAYLTYYAYIKTAEVQISKGAYSRGKSPFEMHILIFLIYSIFLHIFAYFWGVHISYYFPYIVF